MAGSVMDSVCIFPYFILTSFSTKEALVLLSLMASEETEAQTRYQVEVSSRFYKLDKGKTSLSEGVGQRISLILLSPHCVSPLEGLLQTVDKVLEVILFVSLI